MQAPHAHLIGIAGERLDRAILDNFDGGLVAIFPRLLDDPGKQAVEMPDGRMSYGELDAASANLAARLPAAPVALWATPTLATIVGLVAALRAGVPVIPVNPKSGEMELAHILADAAPAAVLAGRGTQLPAALAQLARIDADGEPAAEVGGHVGVEPPSDAPALILYTSGTTGRPKGVVQTRASVIANLDALAESWRLTGEDVVAHSLPLFHVHGLVLGTIGPLRLGGQLRHLGSFDVDATARALEDGASVMFGVPTMYHRLAAAAERDRRVAAALARPRLLASGSAALSVEVHRTIERLTGRTVVERYGMTETLIIASTRPGEPSRPGYVGTPLPGVSVRVTGEDGEEVPHDDETMGTVWVRGPSVFRDYVHREQATADAFDGDWFDTGDVGVLAPDGALRLVGRAASDMIKSGGYRIAAGEIEAALLTHPAVREAAVRGIPDGDLGERVVAWVVLAGDAHDDELVEHVAGQLTPHKRPRAVYRLDSLPRNELGKVQKQRLVSV
jgi:malonyl-CoA/methylmalonyl-CoA synthetase